MPNREGLKIDKIGQLAAKPRRRGTFNDQSKGT